MASLRRTKTGISASSPNGLASVKSWTVTWLELPDWRRDNEYIVAGYRRTQNHWQGCFTSVFAYLHNETVNIHSHLWGAILFLFFLATFYPTYVKPQQATTWIDSAVFIIFLSSAVFCLSASALFHTSCCHSEKVAERCHAFDYSGIVVLTVGSFYPCIYYGFFCEPLLQMVYLLATTAVGFGAAYTVLNPEYAKPTHRGARTKVFIGLGLSAVVPVTHGFLAHGFIKLLAEMGFGWLLISGGLYVSGALLYANRIPERLAPGRFDYFFSSHQIFHVCVVLAALAHYAIACAVFRVSTTLYGVTWLSFPIFLLLWVAVLTYILPGYTPVSFRKRRRKLQYPKMSVR